jgi:hypothetical protein
VGEDVETTHSHAYVMQHKAELTYLQLDTLSIELNIFYLEIDTNSGDKRGRERIVRVPQKEACFPHA